MHKACLGRMYHCGRGVDENHSLAVKWFRKEAEQGYADAQFRLEYMYEDGVQIIDQNDSTTVDRKAAELGHVDAQCTLGEMYENG